MFEIPVSTTFLYSTVTFVHSQLTEVLIATKKSSSSNTPAYATPPPTVATTNLQNMVDKPVDYSVPIRNSYARAEQNFNRSFKNPLGAYTTADVRDKTVRENKQQSDQSLGLDLSNAAQQSSQNQFNRQATVAGLTAPNFYNAKTSQDFTGGDVLGIASGVGQSLLT